RRGVLGADHHRIATDSYAVTEKIARRPAIKGGYSDSPLLNPRGAIAHEDVGSATIVIRIGKAGIRKERANYNRISLDRDRVVAEEVARPGVARRELLLLAPISCRVTHKHIGSAGISPFFVIAARANDCRVAAESHELSESVASLSIARKQISVIVPNCILLK